jgi:hypothetical protein
MKSAFQTDLDQYEQRLARERWANCSIDERCEIIAMHYLRLANTALCLKKLLEHNKPTVSESYGAMIAHIIEAIRQDHLRSFGVEPAWTLIRK